MADVHTLPRSEILVATYDDANACDCGAYSMRALDLYFYAVGLKLNAKAEALAGHVAPFLPGQTAVVRGFEDRRTGRFHKPYEITVAHCSWNPPAFGRPGYWTVHCVAGGQVHHHHLMFGPRSVLAAVSAEGEG